MGLTRPAERLQRPAGGAEPLLPGRDRLSGPLRANRRSLNGPATLCQPYCYRTAAFPPEGCPLKSSYL
jgi:hypothetical protein